MEVRVVLSGRNGDPTLSLGLNNGGQCTGRGRSTIVVEALLTSLVLWNKQPHIRVSGGVNLSHLIHCTGKPV